MYTVELWAQGAGFALPPGPSAEGAVGTASAWDRGHSGRTWWWLPRTWPPSPPNPAPCRALLLPGHLASPGRGIPAAWVVSYGLTRRDTLTFSSLAQDTLCLALQQELVTLGGVCREPQDPPGPQGRADPWPCWPGQGPSSSWGAQLTRLQGP